MKRLLSTLICAAFLLSLCACSQQEEPAPADPPAQSEPEMPADTPPAPEPPASEPLVLEHADRHPITLAWPEMQNADFWIGLTEDPNAVRMTAEEIRTYNAAVAASYDTDTENLAAWPDVLNSAKLYSLLNHYGPQPDGGYYTPEGRITSDQAFRIGENRNTAAVLTENPVRYGFVTENTILRTFPDATPLYDSPDSWEYDKAAETACKIWEPVLVLHTSADGLWYLARAYDYLGWLPVSDVALCPRAQWDDLCDALQNDRLTVTAARLPLDGSFHYPELDGTVLKMGTRLPLVHDAQDADNAIGDNCYIAQMPLRREDGMLTVVNVRIPLQEDVCEGELPYTTENVLRQVFKLLGHRYGWGGTADGWDCSSICQDVFRTMGFDLPRNSNRQLKIPGFVDVDGQSSSKKADALSGLLPGAMLEMPGHQTMYIGRYEGGDYVIHATHGVYDTNGVFYEANSVIVSSVQSRRSNGKTLMECFRGFSMPVASALQ